ncbi:MAG: transposase [Proteobacteria bacterium SW_6_67_9]|nr:MAG: transposase [Proteobacteria bacterium SW_6_67_9]
MGYADLRKGRYSAPGYEYLVTTVCARRRPVFANAGAAQRLVECLQSLDAEEARVTWLAWVVMPDHFHGLLALAEGKSLGGAMQRLKGRSAHSIGGPLWQKGFHDHALRLEEDREALARYVVANPLRAGLVDRIETYPYWYCAWPVV